MRSDIVGARTIDRVLLFFRVFVRRTAFFKSGVLHNHFAFDLFDCNYVLVYLVSRLLVDNFVKRVILHVKFWRFSVDQLLLTVKYHVCVYLWLLVS